MKCTEPAHGKSDPSAGWTRCWGEDRVTLWNKRFWKSRPDDIERERQSLKLEGVSSRRGGHVGQRYFRSPVAIARVAFLRKRIAKQVWIVFFSSSLLEPQEPSAFCERTMLLAPSRYQSWSPNFSVP